MGSKQPRASSLDGSLSRTTRLRGLERTLGVRRGKKGSLVFALLGWTIPPTRRESLGGEFWVYILIPVRHIR